jgi:hypothetical protein
MYIAVLFTGALRTIQKTIKYLKQNVVLGSNVHIFACIQNDDHTDWDNWLKEQLGDNLKHVEWFRLEKHPGWIAQRELLISKLQIPDNWKNYLRTSGSMIEYLQLLHAYLNMCFYEQVNGIKYDYIIKSRTDTIYAKPIDFHWLNWTDQEVLERVEKIRLQLNQLGHDDNSTNIIRYFMSTMISDDFIPNLGNIWSEYLPNRDNYLPPLSGLNDYIKNGSYILTIRANNLYIVRRSLFNMIPSLAYMYGFYRYPNDDDYWFNAETQFRGACYNSNITVFDWNTLFEDKSLYEYDEARYFDADYNVKNPNMLYCVVRH